MVKKVGIFAAFIIFIYGINVIGKWNSQQKLYKEGNTLEEISVDISVGDYVSFYIDEYFYKEIYVEDNIEYEIYTILEERDTENNANFYIQIMVKNEETKQKLNNIGDERVYFQGVVLDDTNGSFKFGEEWGTFVPEGMDEYQNTLCRNWAIKETEIPDESYDLYIGIALVILSIIAFCVACRIKGSEPEIKIKPSKFIEYNYKYNMQTHNIRNEWICEKDNLKKLYAEREENDKVCKIMIAMFVIGLLLFIGDTSILKGSFLWIISFILKLFSVILMYIGVGGIWSKYINSSLESAVKIAKKKGKRSLYLEIEECKKNIEELERIMEKQNIEEIENIFK